MNRKGFTLVELTVVIFLVGLMLLIAVPRVRDAALTDSLKTTVNYINRAFRELKSTAVRSQVDYVIVIDFDEGLLYSHSTDMTPEAVYEQKKRGYRLPKDVKIADMYRPGRDKISSGEGRIVFFRQGYVQPTIIHLARGEESFTLVLSPFMKEIKTYSRYIDFETL